MKELKSNVIVLVVFFSLAAQASDIVFTPPFTQDDAVCFAFRSEYDFGFGLSESLSEVDPNGGIVVQKVFTSAERVGGRCITDTSGFSQEFSVPASGVYLISFRASVSGRLDSIYYPMLAFAPGAPPLYGKAAFMLELHANVDGANSAQLELFRTDLGWGAFVDEVLLQEALKQILDRYLSSGSGVLMEYMLMVIEAVTPVESWDANDFALSFTAELEEGQTYDWRFLSRGSVCSVCFADGWAKVAFEDLEVTLQEVRITPVGIVGNQPPETPVPLYPEPGSVDVNLTPTLEASAFSDADGDRHGASRWQTAIDSDFNDIVYDSGEIAPCTSIQVPAGMLQNDDIQYWRVRYKDDRNAWSDWSGAADFHTVRGSQIIGYVKDADDGSAVNASIYVCKADDNLVYREWGTGAGGAFGIPVPPGDYYLFVTAGNCINDRTYSCKLTRVPAVGVIQVDPNQMVSVGDICLSDVPDLCCESFSVAVGAVHWGDLITVSGTFANIGTEASGPFTANCYLSLDDEIRSSDLFLGEIIIPGIDPNQTYDVNANLALPAMPPQAFLSGGLYVLGVIVDPNDSVDESDEFNNANRGFGKDKAMLLVHGLADLSGDCRVNFEDYAILACYWMESCEEPDWCGGMDFDRSHQADFNDLGFMANNWLTTCKLDLLGMVPVPGGQFQMGDDAGEKDESPVHPVKVDSFYMGKHEVTCGEYRDYLNYAYSQGWIYVDGGVVYGHGDGYPYCDSSRIHFTEPVFSVTPGKENHPVEHVSWYGAAAYCNWRSQRDGFEACYDLSTWECDFSRSGYRLPTEAEWEYAARGGLSGKQYPWGDAEDASRVNCDDSGDPYETGPQPWTTPVGFYNGALYYKADFDWPGSQTSYQTLDGLNSYGLFDMAGGVVEWCNDWYGPDYYNSYPYDNPEGPPSSPVNYRVLRGGGWANYPQYCRVAYRSGSGPPHSRGDHVGFRIVLKMN